MEPIKNGLEARSNLPASGSMNAADSVLMTTPEAAAYIRKSVSLLLHQRDIAYLPGKPNLYRRKELDVWIDRHMVRPNVRI